MKKTNFRFNVIIIYVILSIILIGILSVISCSMLFRAEKANIEQLMQEMAHRMGDQIDAGIREMDKMTLDIISDRDYTEMLDRLYIENVGSQEYTANHIQYVQKLQKELLIKSISYDTIYQCIVFTRYGDVMSTQQCDYSRNQVKDMVSHMEYLGDIVNLKGRKYILGSHLDPWGKKENVISCLRLLRDTPGELGFVEVQCRTDYLNDICTIESAGNWTVNVIGNDGTVLYPISDNEAIAEDSDSLISVEYHSDYTGVIVVLTESMHSYLASFIPRLLFYLIIGSILIVFSLFYILYTSHRLLKPLNQLKQKIEGISYDNMLDLRPVENANDEIQLLNTAFDEMSIRLNQAMQNQVEYRTLQLRASFDALQRQIQPHFIYNTLSVISAISIEHNVPNISQICYELSNILRYSNTNSLRYVTMQDEVNYTRSYLDLMKYRFEDRLNYQLIYSAEDNTAIFPKLIIQPFVENSFAHSLNHCSGTMNISVNASISKNKWTIIIEDNGGGFLPNVEEELQKKIRSLKESYRNESRLPELDFGGFGIIGTFIRLLIFFDGDVDLSIQNIPGKCRVILVGGVKIDAKI